MKDNELYDAIIAHRARCYHVGGVNYELDRKKVIDFVPKGELANRYRADYELMQQSFIYGKSLDFDLLMLRFENLLERFRCM